jgi:type I restriction enzyme R subunit
VFDKRYLLELLRDFVVFEDDGIGTLDKKVAGYHQFHAVRVAVAETLRAANEVLEPSQARQALMRYEAGAKPGGRPGDRRVGVVWHT